MLKFDVALKRTRSFLSLRSLFIGFGYSPRMGGSIQVDELKTSILHGGVREELKVTSIGNNHYWVVDGARRYLALKAIEREQPESPLLKNIPVQILTDVTGETLLLEALVTNLKVPLREMEMGLRIRSLVEAGIQEDRIVAETGFPLNRVRYLFHLGSVHPDIVHAVELGLVSEAELAVVLDQNNWKAPAAFVDEMRRKVTESEGDRKFPAPRPTSRGDATKKAPAVRIPAIPKDLKITDDSPLATIMAILIILARDPNQDSTGPLHQARMEAAQLIIQILDGTLTVAEAQRQMASSRLLAVATE